MVRHPSYEPESSFTQQALLISLLDLFLDSIRIKDKEENPKSF